MSLVRQNPYVVSETDSGARHWLQAKLSSVVDREPDRGFMRGRLVAGGLEGF
jgi:hypothetical protein